MQVIAGQFKGRKLFAPPGRSTRPTSGKVREAVFNICADIVRGAMVADLFAGTGAMGIEALSRGAGYTVFVEADRGAAELIKKNLAVCRALDRASVFCHDLRHASRVLENAGAAFDLVFMDPPYNAGALGPALQNLIKSGTLAPEAVVVVEHSPSEPVYRDPAVLEEFDRRRYGKTVVSFLSHVVANRKKPAEPI
ncbi:MAG: 16S rRNA (guanine(966)-N(2))-methyltransferase RsmD [Desulfobacterales bacterium]|nr:16S rRNA (guanine(966)-N(2))-methyltransferase RsmD [Desulfobacterales bacterium]